MKTKSIIAALALLPITSAFAGSSITFPGQELKPSSSYEIDLSALSDGISYNIQCDLQNNNNETVDVAMTVFSGMHGVNFITYALDDYSQGNQMGISTGSHTATAFNVNIAKSSVPEKGEIKNLDFTNSITITQCVAKPRV